jgi:hypothetical protein
VDKVPHPVQKEIFQQYNIAIHVEKYVDSLTFRVNISSKGVDTCEVHPGNQQVNVVGALVSYD